MKTTKLEFSTNGFFKKALLLSLFAITTFCATSCSKDDNPAPVVLAPLQDPLSGYLTASGFIQKTINQVNAGNYEFGYSFIPSVNGKMTEIVVKIPDAQSAMRVTIWDKAARTVIRTETIDLPSSGVEAIKQIVAIDLIKDKEYFITYNGNDWYQRSKTDNSAATYPFTVGDIKVTSYAFSSGTAQTMPNTVVTTYYAGDCSFKFQK